MSEKEKENKFYQVGGPLPMIVPKHAWHEE
jgi:hypothetical protein